MKISKFMFPKYRLSWPEYMRLNTHFYLMDDTKEDKAAYYKATILLPVKQGIGLLLDMNTTRISGPRFRKYLIQQMARFR